MSSLVQSPCQSCGACCSHFRVNFYWREAEEPHEGPPVPREMTEDSSDLYRCMKGTDSKHFPRCIALKGKVGDSVRCSIYGRRPTPCRNFHASWADGRGRNPRCDDARRAHGLVALKAPPGSQPESAFDQENQEQNPGGNP